MLDTGATTSLISQSELDHIRHPPIQQIQTTAVLGDGQTKITVNGAVELTITINDITTTITALVVHSLGAKLILGMDWCKLNNVNVNIGKKQVEINHPKYGITTTPFLDLGSVDVHLAECIILLPHHEHIVKMYVPISSANLVLFLPDREKCAKLNVQVSDAFVEIKDFSFYVCIYNPNKNIYKLANTIKLGSIHYQSNDEMMYSILNPANQSSMTEQSAHLNSIQTNEQQESSKSSLLENILQELVMHIDDKYHRNDFLSILRQNKHSFDNSKMTRAKTKIHHTINTGDHLPTSVRPYYKTVQQRKEVQQEVGMLLDQGILRPSNSPWSSPVLLKKKSDGTYRFLVDFRRLNSITKKDSYPQPSAEELLHRLAGHQYFTKVDLKSGYFQIPIHESDIPKTAIITQDGLYEFTVLAQGLMNAPPTFQRVMNELLANGRWDYVVVYLDDIVIFSKTIEEHKQHVADVLSTLHKANFQVSPAKCSIAVEKIEFLSHIVTSDKVEPSLDKIKAIANIAPPKTLSQANKFIGKVGYYRKFIRDFAKIAAPIHKVTNKTRTKRNEFRWGQEQQDAFEKFKSILTSAPLFLDFPNRSVPFILSTDASDLRIAGVLKQDTTDGLKICYYKSRLLNDTESRYSTTEREALAIYWCLTELRNYIGDSEITIETDHKPLVNMHKKRNYGNRRIDNWLIHLQDLIPQIIEIKYRCGIDNIGPDYLTRYETIDSDNQQQSLSAITRSITKKAAASASSSPTVTEDHPITSTPLLKSTSILDLTLEKIKVEQDNDTDIQLIISRIHAQKKMNNYVLYNSVLFRLITKKNDGTKSKVPYLPVSMLNTLLEAFHDHPLSGHFGVQRTLHKIRTRFWWPNMRKSIEHYISSCQQCKKFNIIRSKTPGHLKSFDPPTEVFQVLHMDFWGPVRTSSQGNRYVLVLTDNLSKYVIAKAMSNNTAKATAEFLMNEFIMIHGAPERLITDNGVHFNNTLMKTITAMMNTIHAFSASYHPQTNGQVERFNATFCTQLAKYYDENEDDWDDYLQSVVYAYNTGIHATTGFVPYELAFGRRQKSPFDSNSSNFTLTQPDTFFKHLQKIRRTILKQAQENIRHQQQLTKLRYDKHRKDMSYSIGDLVFLKVCVGRTKLGERWIGPCQVTNKTGEQSYFVQDKETGKST
ncbi:unnamed protein product [Rotaria sp. Silwood2]|nr:unnamed protein product [Rotaria sp. Silwood2]